MINFFYACTEAPLTEYERQRAQTMMRNNQVLRSLGVTTLASILNSSSAKKKAAAREDSGSLYEPQDTEGTEDDIVDKVFSIRYIFIYCLHLFSMISHFCAMP